MTFRHGSIKKKRWASLIQTKKLLMPVYGVAALALIFNPIMPLAKYLQTAHAASSGVVINEIFTNGSNDWVEIYNNGPSTIGQGNFQDYKVTDSDGNEWDFPKQNFNSGEYFVVETSNRFNDGGDTITLFDKQGNELDSVEYGGTGYDVPETDESLSRLSNGTGDFTIAKPTKDTENQPLDADKPVENIDTSETFVTIQAAIDDSDTADGHTIEVSGGTYDSFGTSFGGDEDLTIKAKTGASPVIEDAPSGADRIVDLRADGTTLNGFTIRSTDAGNGVGVSVGGRNVTVTNNTIEDVLTGVQTLTHYSVGNAIVTDNTISAKHGISFQNKNSIAKHNEINTTIEGFGVIGTDNTIEYNNVNATSGVQAQAYGGITLDVTKNWWGAATGPTTLVNDVIADPWLCQPFQDGLSTSVNGVCEYSGNVTYTNNYDGTGVLEFNVEDGDGDPVSGLAAADFTVASNTGNNFSFTHHRFDVTDNGNGNYTALYSPHEHVDSLWDISINGHLFKQNLNVVVTNDDTAPDAPTITSPGARTWHKTAPITNSWTAVSDDSGIDYYQIAYNYDDGHSFGGSTCPGVTMTGYAGFIGCRDVNGTSRNHTPASWEQGGVTIWVRAVDNAGNAGPWSSSVHYYYDHESPETDITVSGFEQVPDRLTDHKFTVSGTAEDNQSLNRVYVQLVNRDNNQRYGGTTIHLIGEGTDANWSKTYDANAMGLPDGNYAAHVAVVDMAGNKGTAGWTDNFVVDTNAPQQATDPQFYFGHTKSGTAMACSATDGPIYTNTDDVLIDWEHAGPSDVEYYWFGIDNANNYNETHKNSKDNPGEFIDGGTAYKVDITSANNNPHRYLVTAVDAAGNKSTILETCPVILDQEDPVTEVVAPADGDLVNGTVDIMGNVEDDNPSHYFIRITNMDTDNEVFSEKFNMTGSITGESLYSWDTLGVDDGQYKLFVATRDLADNKDGDKNTPGVSVDSITVTVDNTAPSVLINGPADGDVLSGTVNVLGDVLDNFDLSHYNLSLYPSSTDLSDGLTHSSDRVNNNTTNPLGWGGGTVNVSGASTSVSRLLDTTLLTDGEYQLRLAARDAAGNRDTSSTDGSPNSVHVIAFTVDNTAPDVNSNNTGTEGQVGGVQTNNQQNQSNQQQSSSSAFQPQTTNTDNNGENETDENEDNNSETTSTTTDQNDQENGEVAGASTGDTGGGGFSAWWLVLVPAVLGILFFALRRRTNDDQA